MDNLLQRDLNIIYLNYIERFLASQRLSSGSICLNAALCKNANLSVKKCIIRERELILDNHLFNIGGINI